MMGAGGGQLAPAAAVRDRAGGASERATTTHERGAAAKQGGWGCLGAGKPFDLIRFVGSTFLSIDLD